MARDATEISLLDIVEAIDGPVASGLPANVSFPEQSSELLRVTLRRIAESTRRQLAATKLSDLQAALPLMKSPVTIGSGEESAPSTG